MGMFTSVLGLVASSFLVGQGLTGTEVTVEHQINDRWAVGVSYSRSSMDLLKIDDVEIDVRLTTLRANYYPFRGNLFLSGGVLHNNSRADYKENFSETITAKSSVLDLEGCNAAWFQHLCSITRGTIVLQAFANSCCNSCKDVLSWSLTESLIGTVRFIYE